MSDLEEEKLDKIDKQILKECSYFEFEKLTKVLVEIETESGGTHSTNVWKEFRKAYPKKIRPVPTGVKNIIGKVITNAMEKKDITFQHFGHRMRKRLIHRDFIEVTRIQEKTFLGQLGFQIFLDVFAPYGSKYYIKRNADQT